MPEPAFPLVDAREILRVVGGAAFTRGKGYASGGNVLEPRWDEASGRLSSPVAGTESVAYRTHVDLVRKKDAWAISSTHCTCPVGLDCKHAAALLIRSNSLHLQARDQIVVDTTAPAPAWEEGLRPLLAASADAAPSPGRARPGRSAERDALQDMALQFDLQDTTVAAHRQWAPGSGVGHQKAATRRYRLGVRPMVRSAGNGRWVRGNLRWNTISFKTYGLTLDAEQHRWFCQFVPLYRANGQLYFGEDNDWLYLDEFSSPLLWPLLAEAATLGIELIGTDPSTRIQLAAPAAVALDAHRIPADGGAAGAEGHDGGAAGAERPGGGAAPGDLVLRPVIALDGRPVPLEPGLPCGPIGTHGAYVAEPDGSAVVLAPAASGRWDPAELQALREPATVTVPAADVEGFTARVHPRLGRRIAVTSLDGSVHLPEILPPTLVLDVTYPGGDAAELAWRFDYGPVEPDADTRDAAAETALERAALDVLGDSPALAGAVLAPKSLHGLETVDFLRRVLPALRDLEDTRVDEHGTRPEYRELTGSPELTVTAVESDKRDWFDLGLVVAVGEHRIPYADILRALSRGQTKMLMPDRTWFSLEQPLFDKLRALVAEASQLSDKPGELRLTRYQASLWEELDALAAQTEGPDSWYSGVGSLLTLAEAEPAPLPAGLNAQLRPYQREGFTWLARLWRQGLGGVLADDMGLGKTLQALALVLHAHEEWAAAEAAGPARGAAVGTAGAAGPDGAGAEGAPPSSPSEPGPFLVVAPTSVVGNWVEEAAKFAPSLRVTAVTDTQGRASRTLADTAAEHDIVVTSYTLFRLDQEAYAARTWAGLVLDEAQFVKNKATKAHHAARDLDARFKLAITGTPMENNLMELWSIFAIVSPGLFPSAVRFGEHYARPIEKQGLAEPLARLRRRVRPFMLRRTKDAVVTDLPPKQEQVLHVELAPRHRKVYDTHLQRERQKILRLVEDMDRNRFTIFQSLTLLRMLSLDASLVDPEQYEGVPSAKLDLLFEQLEDILAEGHRVLVFSQFTSFLKKAAARLQAEKVPYAYLDGSTRRRADVIESFKAGDAPVFLISLKAGGFGLNLTEADYCFLLDPWWNPAAESQAVDRAHRIGQTRNVMVYRMVAQDTIEEKVVALQDAKRQLISSVMDEGEGFGAALTADDIRSLLAD